MHIRNARTDDFTQILRLNDESVHFLSPLDHERLTLLHGQAAYHRVSEDEGEVVAFLLAFGEGAAYDSPNYRWFAGRFERFLYIDRVVVDRRQQGRGIGQCFYADLLSFARASGARLVTCEFDLDPPNDQSRRFHASFGFREVGTQFYAAAGKQVSLQALSIDPVTRA
ncbi:GNAT family N-acetyltransferase [Accumulibacter sp.]|uniref:GNAT family N-acetyltransferase n=1 Tax=Accumulibacter sp. TaxID=2053492 RepID=UPI0025BAE059|nr:GNAT family N-acetyltransferase [Accumulibacter sp.]